MDKEKGIRQETIGQTSETAGKAAKDATPAMEAAKAAVDKLRVSGMMFDGAIPDGKQIESPKLPPRPEAGPGRLKGSHTQGTEKVDVTNLLREVNRLSEEEYYEANAGLPTKPKQPSGRGPK